MTRKNGLPAYAEEKIIQVEKSTQTQLGFEDILKEKIKAPWEFTELKTVGKNYICSTQGWPKEPVCERYGFSANGKWIQLDISHQLMEKLGLELGKEITLPIYISPAVLEKNPDEFGGITVDDEKEIFIERPLTEEKEVQTELNSNEILEEKDNQISQLKQKNESLEVEKKQIEEIFKYILKLWLKDKEENYELIKKEIWMIGTDEAKHLSGEGVLKFVDFPAAELDLSFLTTLNTLEINNSQNLRELKLPSSLGLFINNCQSLKELDLSNGLQGLSISECKGFRQLELTNTDIKNLYIHRCPNLEELKLPSNDEFFLISINDCPNLKEIRLNGGRSLRISIEGFFGVLDITQGKSFQGLNFQETPPDDSNLETVKLKCKVVFTKSQSQENISMVKYNKNNFTHYLYNQPVSLDFLVKKGVLINYEEKD